MMSQDEFRDRFRRNERAVNRVFWLAGCGAVLMVVGLAALAVIAVRYAIGVLS